MDKSLTFKGGNGQSNYSGHRNKHFTNSNNSAMQFSSKPKFSSNNKPGNGKPFNKNFNMNKGKNISSMGNKRTREDSAQGNTYFNNKRPMQQQEQQPQQRQQQAAKAESDAPAAMPIQRSRAPPLWMKASKDFKPSRNSRDPRFDDLSGKLDVTAFAKNYSFVETIKEKELVTLAEELETTEDPQERKRIKMTIQRINNKSREKKKIDAAKKVKSAEREQIIESLKQGKKPFIKSKSVLKLEGLAKQFHILKKENRLDKYMEKKEKKIRAKQLFEK